MTTSAPPADSTLARDLLTASAGVLATAVVLALLTQWSGTVNGAVFVLTAAALAWQGGFRRGLYASVLASVALWLLVVVFDPLGAARAPLRTLTLLLSCLAVSWLCGNIHAARRQVALEQRRLRESEQFHRVIAELAADFAFHGRFVSDTEVTIDACTPGLPMLIGYEIADLERQSWLGRVYPDDRQRVDAAIAQARQGHAVTGTCRLRARDGRTVFIEFRVHPERDAAGAVIGLVGAVRDITHAHDQAEALVNERRRFEVATKALSGLIYEWDVVSGEVRRFGGIQGITGFPEDQVEPTSEWWSRRVFPEDAPRIAGNWAATLARRDARLDCTYRFVQRGGQVRHVWDCGYLTYDAEGRCVRCTGYTVDVTERVLAEEELRRARDRAETHAQEIEEARAALNDQERLLRMESQRKDEFLATLAHELRNPLAPLCSATTILTSDPALSATSRQATEVASRQLQHMVRLVDDLLDISRISRGHLELRPQFVDLRAVVASACDDGRAQLADAGIGLTVELADIPCGVRADPARMSQVVANLLSNAMKFTPRGGQVTVSVRPADGAREVALVVRDTGIGIDAAERDRVFDMFVQLNRETRQAQSGLGIGLAMVKRIAELHDGAVSVWSKGMGHGAEITVTVPLAVDVNLAATTPPAQAAPIAGRRILVADDSRDGADSLALLLRACGHEVWTAYDGQAAVHGVERHQPDLALIDLGMPGVSGYDAARAIRREPWGRGVRLVALTGWGQDDHRRRSRDAGFDEHLVKPLELDTLERLLATWGTRPGSGARLPAATSAPADAARAGADR